MKQTYNIVSDLEDRRIVSTFTVEGEDDDECEKLSEERFTEFVQSLGLEAE